MMQPTPSQSVSARSGFSQIEILVSTLLVGLVLVAAMGNVGAILRGRLATSETVLAQHLANQLLGEVVACAYVEPDGGAAYGVESPESSTVRALWDDVDDYHLWIANPPQDRWGDPLPNTTGLQQEIVVEWVVPADPTTTAGSDQGVKRITVTITRNGEVLAQRVALRTDQTTGFAP